MSHTHTHIPFNGPFSGTTRVSRYQKGKPIWILLKQETVSGSGISWAICKSAPRSRQITTPTAHRSVFYRPDALPAAQPTASKHWRQLRDHVIKRKAVRQRTCCCRRSRSRRCRVRRWQFVCRWRPRMIASLRSLRWCTGLLTWTFDRTQPTISVSPARQRYHHHHHHHRHFRVA